MITMMQHPKHGRHPALGHEIAGLMAAGWTKVPPKTAQMPIEIPTEAPTQAPTEAPAQAAIAAPLVKPKRAYNRKPKA